MKMRRSGDLPAAMLVRRQLLSVVLLPACLAGAARAQVVEPEILTTPAVIAPVDARAGQRWMQAFPAPATDDDLPAYLRASGSGVVLQDPWEPYNRRIFRFNTAVDEHVAIPVARAYTRHVPAVVRTGVTHFFQNLRQVPTAVNLLLQGDAPASVRSLGSFAVNTTVGIGGLFDPATRMHLPRYREDFGQTMAGWGWHHSRYFVVPLLGPGTLRDDLGRLVDSQASIFPYVQPASAQGALVGVSLLDIRSRTLHLGDMATGIDDPYALFRDAWGQYREHQIQHEGAQTERSNPEPGH